MCDLETLRVVRVVEFKPSGSCGERIAVYISSPGVWLGDIESSESSGIQAIFRKKKKKTSNWIFQA